MTSPEKKARPPRFRLMRALMVAVPSVVLVFSAVMLILSGLRLHRGKAAPAPGTFSAPAAAAAEAAPSPAGPYRLRVDAFSTAGDLYVLASAQDGGALPDGPLVYTLVAPDGTQESFPAARDGSLYIPQLEPGLYTVRLAAGGEYPALPCAVEVLALPHPSVSGNAGFQEVDGLSYYFDRSGKPVTGLKQIDGRMYYFNLYGVRAAKLGIDVSYHNLGINWPAVKAQGIDFAIIRVGYRGWESGLLWEDERFVQNLRGAKSAGIDVGVYVYSTAVNPIEARKEADFVVGMLGGTDLEYPVYFDTEQSGEYPNGRADRLSKADRAPIIRAFCDRIRAAGYTPGVYSGLNFLKNHVDRSVYAPYTTWLANYTRYNRLPDFPYDYDMWQFTDSGHVGGIRGIVDMNVVY